MAKGPKGVLGSGGERLENLGIQGWQMAILANKGDVVSISYRSSGYYMLGSPVSNVNCFIY